MGNLGYLPKCGSLSLLRQKRKLEPLAETMILAIAHVAQSETASSSPLSRFDIPHPDRVDAAPLAVKRRLEIPAETVLSHLISARYVPPCRAWTNWAAVRYATRL